MRLSFRQILLGGAVVVGFAALALAATHLAPGDSGGVREAGAGRTAKRSINIASSATAVRCRQRASISKTWTPPTSRPTAPRGRSCCASCATARCRLPACRGPMRPPMTRWSSTSRPGAIAWPRRSPIPDAPRCIGSIERNTGTPFAICWRWRSTSRSCCRPTTSATASTTSATCCRYRPCCWSDICRRRARSAAPRSAIRRSPSPIRPTPFLMGSIQTDRLSEAAPVGSRGGTIVRHLFPVDGEYEISVTLQTEQGRRILGPRAGTQARSQARRSAASAASPLRPIRDKGRARRRNRLPMRISRSACR